MSRNEVDITRYGELMDLIACDAIYNGADPKKKKMSQEQVLAMR